MINKKCPRCGGNHVQLTNERSKHGCLWFLLLGWLYIILVLIKWAIGLTLLCCVDWWMAIIKAVKKKGYVWKSARWFSGVRRTYYCHDCGYNFKG